MAHYSLSMKPIFGHFSFGSKRDPVQTAEQQRRLWETRLELMRARQLLASSLDALDVGLEIWDDQDRLVLYNKKNNSLQAGAYIPDDVGKTYQALLQSFAQRRRSELHLTDDASLLERRRIPRPGHQEPRLQELPGDRWINTYEAMTPEGYLVIMRVNVTDLVRQGRQLEASNHQLALQSATDSLTGLANRRNFDEVLLTEWQRASRGGTSLSLLMVDIDHFKRYNDHYGHLAGDECLRRVAKVLGRCVRRAGEVVARYGGEEFVILLPAADLVHACETAQMCLQWMQQENIQHAASPTADQVTLSIGVACVQPDGMLNPSALINASDAAMYRAKTAGRARCEVATQADWDIDSETPRTQPAPFL